MLYAIPTNSSHTNPTCVEIIIHIDQMERGFQRKHESRDGVATLELFEAGVSDSEQFSQVVGRNR